MSSSFSVGTAPDRENQDRMRAALRTSRRRILRFVDVLRFGIKENEENL